MNTWLLILVLVCALSSSNSEEHSQSFLGLEEIQELLKNFEANELETVMISMDNDSDDRQSGDELGIRAGGEPPLKTGEAPRNTIVASTKMRFKIPDMNA